MSKRIGSLVFLTLLVLALVAGPSVRPVDAEPRNQRGGGEEEVQPIAAPVFYDGGIAWFPDNGEAARCTADCGDGTGWECTGASVTCVDGEGCIAEGSNGEVAIGLCAAN